jgi:hypothetical protein
MAVSRTTVARFIGVLGFAAALLGWGYKTWEIRHHLVKFAGPSPIPTYPSSHVLYSFNLDQERFFVRVPKSYDGRGDWGLIVYDSSQDVYIGTPRGWAPVLNADRLLFIAPQQAGNDQESSRREGLCVVAALEMERRYAINRKRVYIAGLSGGAWIASGLGFHQWNVFRASIQCSGSTFYRSVPRVAVTDADLTRNPQPYGLMSCDPDEIEVARKSVKFAITTGPGDFREHFLQDIYHGGFAADGFQAKLWDVPAMGHEPCSASTLRDVLAFIEGGAAAP